jgi:hypothetical protein
VSLADSINISVIPEVPRTGEPIVASFSMANPTDMPLTTRYELYVNGGLVESGTTIIGPQTSTQRQYAYRNSLARGEQVNFLLRTSSDIGDTDKAISLPAYPSQLMSSFVSFAAFSTSVMNSMVSMEYFSNTFGMTNQINTGLILTAVLIVLLIFLELTQVMTSPGRFTVISGYRAGFTTMSTILFIILVGIVFTRVVMIIAT